MTENVIPPEESPPSNRAPPPAVAQPPPEPAPVPEPACEEPLVEQPPASVRPRIAPTLRPPPPPNGAVNGAVTYRSMRNPPEIPMNPPISFSGAFGALIATGVLIVIIVLIELPSRKSPSRKIVSAVASTTSVALNASVATPKGPMRLMPAASAKPSKLLSLLQQDGGMITDRPQLQKALEQLGQGQWPVDPAIRREAMTLVIRKLRPAEFPNGLDTQMREKRVREIFYVTLQWKGLPHLVDLFITRPPADPPTTE